MAFSPKTAGNQIKFDRRGVERYLEMRASWRTAIVFVLFLAVLLSVVRLVRLYYGHYRAKKLVVEEKPKGDSTIRNLLGRTDAPSAIRNGGFPCISASFGASPSLPALGECTAPGQLSGPVDLLEVDLRYGNFVLRQTDLYIDDVFQAPLTRTYNSGDYIHPNRKHAFGMNGNHPFDIAPLGTRNPYTYQVLAFEDGDFLFFDRVSPGTGYADAVYQHTETSTRFYKAVTKWNGNGWTTWLTDGTRIEFPESYKSTNMAQGAPTAFGDDRSREMELVRDNNGNLLEVRTPHGRLMRFQYDEQSRIVTAQGDRGQSARYQYNVDGMLTKAALPSGYERHYFYDGVLMTRVEDENHKVLVQNTFSGRSLIRQDFGNGQVFSYKYSFGSSRPYADSVVVTLPDGSRTTIETGSSIPELMKHPRN